VELEAAVAGSGLALGARERVLLARRRIEEDGKVASDGDVAGGAQLFGIGADDDPVAIAARQSEQLVTHCAADEIALHRFKGVCSRVVTGYRQTVARPPRPRDAPLCLRSLESPSAAAHDRAAIRPSEEL